MNSLPALARENAELRERLEIVNDTNKLKQMTLDQARENRAQAQEERDEALAKLNEAKSALEWMWKHNGEGTEVHNVARETLERLK